MCLGIPGKIIAMEGQDALERLAHVSFGGIIKKVSVALVPEAREGDYVIVHAGFALQILDQQEAQQVFTYLQEIVDLGELEDSPG